jgi:MFS family permease
VPRVIAAADADRGRAWCAVVAATVLNIPLGSLYSFSVFLGPLEALLGLGRADLAIVFAVAALGFGVGMNAGPAAGSLAPAPILILISAGTSALGIALAATASGLWQLALGWGALFGIGGGASYLVVQQAANLAVSSRHGLLNGYLVSLLPVGAMIASPLFGWALRLFGVRAALGGLAAALAVTGLASAWLLARDRVVHATSAPAAPDADGRLRSVFWRLWVIFFLAASAGLMVLSQAAGIIAAYGGAPSFAIYGTTVVTGVIAAARIAGGWMSDWISIPLVAAGAHAIALGGSVALSIWPGPAMSVAALALVGLGYGIMSGVVAAAVATYWPRPLYGRVAGRLYVAWCMAAVVLPIAAGRLFDLTQGYGVAILIAAGGNALGALVALGLPRPGTLAEARP